LLFPNGIQLNVQNGTVQTQQVNKIFECIALQKRVSSEYKNRKADGVVDFSNQVIRIGFEPMTYCLEGSCSIQLSYRTSLNWV
jgi:hypothetical protein